jgi:hypothetical protein
MRTGNEIPSSPRPGSPRSDQQRFPSTYRQLRHARQFPRTTPSSFWWDIMSLARATVYARFGRCSRIRSASAIRSPSVNTRSTIQCGWFRSRSRGAFSVASGDLTSSKAVGIGIPRTPRLPFATRPRCRLRHRSTRSPSGFRRILQMAGTLSTDRNLGLPVEISHTKCGTQRKTSLFLAGCTVSGMMRVGHPRPLPICRGFDCGFWFLWRTRPARAGFAMKAKSVPREKLLSLSFSSSGRVPHPARHPE